MLDNPKFSVIIPTYNRTSFLWDSVQSILSQPFQNLEIIIIDDHSEPHFLQKVIEITNLDNRIRLISKVENQGVSASRNDGIELAKGEFLLFLDDDDCVVGPIFDVALEMFAKEEIDVVIIPSEIHPESRKDLFHYHVVKQTLKLQPYRRTYSPYNLHLILKYPPQINSMVFRKTVFQGQKFDSQIKFGEDIFLWLTLICNGAKFSKKVARYKNVRALIRVHGQNHLSQTSDANVVWILKKLLTHFSIDQKIVSIINLKLTIRYLLMRDYKKLIMTLILILKNPFIFLMTVGSQLRVKISIFLSFYFWKYTGIDI